MRTKKKVTAPEPEKSVTEIKEIVLSTIKDKYGSVAAFLETPEAKALGNIRPYLYPKGAVSYSTLKELCKLLSIGELSRNIRVSRSISYTIDPIHDATGDRA